jgi:hypothetical protein
LRSCQHSWAREAIAQGLRKMPQPLSKVRSNANVSLHLEHSTNNAELAVLVTGIFARWAWIEHQLSILLLHILDAEAKPALAMLSELKTQKLQMSAMRAAAKAVLSPELFETFAAVMFAVDCVQNDRNRLAHWVWGTSPELPDRLLLVNPESLKATSSVPRASLENASAGGDFGETHQTNRQGRLHERIC